MIIEKKILPPRLMPGDRVGIAAPAGSFGREWLRQGADILESMGFRVFLPPGLFEKKGYLAGSDRHRARMLTALFADASLKAVLCARGGFGAVRLLPLLDFETIRKNPKVFVGFSDISALLSAFRSRCGLVTFHGPVLTTLGNADESTKKGLLRAVSGEEPLEMKAEKGIVLRSGCASGPVAGGNLATLCHLLGTPFAPDFRGHILFLEDVGEPSYRIDRMLTQMNLAGCFDGIVGLVLGSFENCGKADDIFRIVNNVFGKKNIPMLAGLDAGHGASNLTIPMGIAAVLNADRHLLSCQEAATLRSPEVLTGMGNRQTEMKKMKAIDEFMREGVYNNKVFPGGVLFVAKEGDILFFEAYGHANLFSGREMIRDTVFDLASLTKPLATTLATMLLVQEGKLDIDQELGTLLTEFSHGRQGKIKIRHLLTHNSGLPDWRPYYKRLRTEPGKPRDALRTFLVREPLASLPGEKVLYSDLGFMILAWLIERISGERLDRFVRENIYAPLGLDDLFFTDVREGPSPDRAFAATERCPWRGLVLEGLVHDDNAYAAGGIEGHAGLFGAARDVAALLSELLDAFHGRSSASLFRRDVVEAFFRRQEGTGRALGFDMPSPGASSCGCHFPEHAVGHLGFTGTSFWMDTDRSLMVILLSNRVHPSRGNLRIKAFRPELHNIIMRTFGMASR